MKEAGAQTGGDPMDKKRGGWSGKHIHSRVLSHVQNISAKDGQGMKQWLLWGGELDGWGPGKGQRPDFHGTAF